MKGNWMKNVAAAITAAGLMTGFGMTVQAQTPADLWEYTQLTDEDDHIIYDFKEVEVMLPADWSGKYGIDMRTDSITFFHRNSRQALEATYGNEFGSGGRLFSIGYSEDYGFTNTEPAYSIIGSGQTGVYYLSMPTDVQGYTEDAGIWNEWRSLCDGMDWVREHITIISPGEIIVDRNQVVNVSNLDITGEYILAESSDRYLEETELDGMNADELQMAINEIYARHHRKFVTRSIQDYFDSKSWYSGTVEAADFDPGVMNPYEGSNIMLMLKRMNLVQTGSAASSGTVINIISGGTRYTTADVNVRKGASSDTAVVAVALKGTAVTVTGNAVNGWYPISCQNVQGYIYQDYLK